jgi:KRAB domain-containing zinc finger protein
MQRHLRECIKTRRKLEVTVQRLSEEQILALSKPHSVVRDRKHLESAQFLQHYVDLGSNPMPGNYKCNFEQCNLIFSSSAFLKKHRKVHLPALSCNECGRLFRVKRLLLLHIQRHLQLRPYGCDVPGCTYSAKVHDDLKSHKKTVHSCILYTCLQCGKSIKTHISYKLHVAKHKIDGALLKCVSQSSKQKFLNVDDLQKHVKEAHKLLQCNECGKCLTSKYKLRRHVVTHWHCRPFKCDIPDCSYSAKWSRDLQRHKNEVHTLARFTCSYCGKNFKSRARFNDHEKKHKTSTPGVLKCLPVGCQETFLVPSDLEMNMKHHKMHKCDIPGCLFTSELKLDLYVHRRKVHPNCAQNCHLCGKSFKKNKYLKQHMRSHETGEPGVIKCARIMCKQTFTSVAYFKKHLDNHKTLILRQNASKSKKFECHLCSRSIKGDKKDIKSHVERHKTDTPGVLKCTYWNCKQTFPSATDLKQHTANHWDISFRPFACNFPKCNFAATHKVYLYLHKRQVHSSKLYTCDMCGKQFKNLSSLVRHLRRYHKIQQSEEDPNSAVESPKIAEEYQEVVCKDEIEEVVFD